MKAYQAYSKAGRITRDTARAAAMAYFDSFPASRKCNVVEGKTDGPFFRITYGRSSFGEWPKNYKDATKKTAQALPEEA